MYRLLLLALVAVALGRAQLSISPTSGGVGGASNLTTASQVTCVTSTGVVGMCNAETSPAVTKTGLGTTTAIGLQVANTTAAAAGAQQVSPTIRWTGQGWKTDATAASQAVEFRSYVLPVQGAAAPTGNWLLSSAINGGAFSTVLTITSAGSLTAASHITSGADLSAPSGSATIAGNGNYSWQSRSVLQSPANGVLTISNNALTATGTISVSGTAMGFGPSNTSPTGTVHVYDATATTGVTTLTVRAGAANNGNTDRVLSVQTNAGTETGGISGQGFAFLKGITIYADGLPSGNQNAYLGYQSNGLGLRNDWTVQWSSTTASNGSLDLILARDAAGTLAQRNGANAQALRVYGTFTDASNYERAALTTTAGSGISLLAETAGTGGDNLNITLTPSGTGRVLTTNFSLTGDVTLPFVMAKTTQAATAPTAGNGLLRWEVGTNAGTLKLVAYSGTSTTGVTIVDNVGGGN